MRLLNALNSEDRGLKVRFSLAMIVFETFELILCQMLSSQGKNAPSDPYPHYLVRLAASRYRVVPRAHPSRPFFNACFHRSGSKGAFRLRGATWDRFRCAVEPSPSHIRCRVGQLLREMNPYERNLFSFSKESDIVQDCGGSSLGSDQLLLGRNFRSILGSNRSSLLGILGLELGVVCRSSKIGPPSNSLTIESNNT